MKASGIQGMEGEVAEHQRCLWLGWGTLYSLSWMSVVLVLLVALWACRGTRSSCQVDEGLRFALYSSYMGTSGIFHLFFLL